MSLEEEGQPRMEFMRRLKDEIDGSSAWSVDPRIIGNRMGLDGWDTRAIVNQLVEAAFVEEVYGEEVHLTDAGRREVEQSQSVSTDSQMTPNISMYFGGNAYGVQAGTVGSNQYVRAVADVTGEPAIPVASGWVGDPAAACPGNRICTTRR